MNSSDPTPSSEAPEQTLACKPMPKEFQDKLPEKLRNAKLPCYVDFDLESPLGVLILTVRDHLVRLSKDQRRHKAETTQITMLTVSLSAISSVLLGLSFKDPATSWFNPVYLKNVALLFTALIAIVNAYDALYKPHRLWIREGKSYGQVKDILLELELRAARVKTEPVTKDEVEAFRSKLAGILQDDLEAWVRQHGENLLTRKATKDPTTDSANPAEGAK